VSGTEAVAVSEDLASTGFEGAWSAADLSVVDCMVDTTAFNSDIPGLLWYLHSFVNPATTVAIRPRRSKLCTRSANFAV
jgi:hypothetical protein